MNCVYGSGAIIAVMKFMTCISVYFISKGQIIQPPTIMVEVVNEINVSLFSGELDNEHCDGLMPVEEREVGYF
jgi:hypothetical protein